MVDVAQLSDAALKEELVSHGINPGPITPSTRSVYEKKLNKILNDTSLFNQTATESFAAAPPSPAPRSPAPPSPAPQAVIDPVESRKSPIPTPVFQTTSNQEENGDASDAEEYEGEESMRYLTEEEMHADRQKYAKNTRSGGYRKILIISTAIASIAVFSYFLLENAESLLLASSSLSSSSSSNDNTI